MYTIPCTCLHFALSVRILRPRQIGGNDEVLYPFVCGRIAVFLPDGRSSRACFSAREGTRGFPSGSPERYPESLGRTARQRCSDSRASFHGARPKGAEIDGR